MYFQEHHRTDPIESHWKKVWSNVRSNIQNISTVFPLQGINIIFKKFKNAICVVVSCCFNRWRLGSSLNRWSNFAFGTFFFFFPLKLTVYGSIESRTGWSRTGIFMLQSPKRLKIWSEKEPYSLVRLELGLYLYAAEPEKAEPLLLVRLELGPVPLMLQSPKRLCQNMIWK
jgi:hypothetical protein